MASTSADDAEKPGALSGAGFESGAFESLEGDFQEVLQELVGDKSLERFRVEYEKLHRALKKSHESEKRLIKKCRELNQEIVANAAKVQTALKLSQEDQNTIASLKREIEKAWKMVDAAHEKEGRAKETIQQLKHEIQNLSRLVEQGAGLSIGQENTVNELMKVKQELAKERDAQAQQIHLLKVEASDMVARLAGMDDDAAAQQEGLAALRETIDAKREEAEKEEAKKERAEKELKGLKAALDARQNEIREKQAEHARNVELAGKLEIGLREEKGRTDKAGKDNDTAVQKSLKAQRELDDLALGGRQLVAEGRQREAELKLRLDELNGFKADGAKVMRTAEAYDRKIEAELKGKAKQEEERDSLRAAIKAEEESLAATRTARAEEKKRVETVLRDRDMKNKELVKASGATAKVLDTVKVHENTRKNLEVEIAGYKAEAHKQRKAIFQLEVEGEKYGAEAAEASAKYAHALDEVKVRELGIVQLQKRIADGDAKMKQQQSLYEAVRSDRNLYSKNLIESQDEIAEMKRRFKIMNHQIEQLKEEIHAKDQSLVKEHFDRMKVEKEKESLRDQLRKLKELAGHHDDVLGKFTVEVAKLNAVISEADQERQRQKKECEVVVNERDILGTQLIRRNEELGLLYERIRIGESMLLKGESQYSARVKELETLLAEIGSMQGERKGMSGSVNNVDALRNELYQLQRELLQERTKVRALSEELENPMNVHRWRKLEGSDPATYELVQKIHMLQKRLIEKSEEVVEKDLLIHHKEKLYVELKNILARQPGPEVAEQLSLYQQSLKERGAQTEAMAQELSLSHAQVSEYKYEISRIGKELRETKKKFFEQKKREQAATTAKRAERAHLTEMLVHEARSTLNRFTGGGFNLNMTAG
jgi:chromosome segregation ATPase